MRKVTRYQCRFCKKDFKTPDRHYCKKNPELKNCFTCKHLKGWDEDFVYGEYTRTPWPDCAAGVDGWDIESIKNANYNMQCEEWEQGTYDWSKESPDEELEAILW